MAEPPGRRDTRATRVRRTKETAGGRFPPLATLVPALVAGVVALAAAVVIVAHYQADAVPDGAAPAPFGQADATASDLDAAQRAAAASPGDPATAARYARAALAGSPLNMTALTTLAAANAALGQSDSANGLYELAFSNSRRSLPALLWKAKDAIRRDDIASLVNVSSIVLLTTSTQETRDQFLGVLVGLADREVARPYLIEAIQKRPTWRADFLDALARQGSSDGFRAVVTALNDPKGDDIVEAWRIFIVRLLNAGQTAEAYATWVSLLDPSEAAQIGYLTNGSFESKPSGLPFDWSIPNVRGVKSEIVPLKSGAPGSALLVSFSGLEVDFRHISQSLLLPAGSFRLSGRVALDHLETTRGLQWRLYCRSGERWTLTGESPFFSGTSDWANFDMTFKIPDTMCDWQVIRLELPGRTPQERVARGRAWFDDLSIDSLAF